jgi:hypothetical protein
VAAVIRLAAEGGFGAPAKLVSAAVRKRPFVPPPPGIAAPQFGERRMSLLGPGLPVREAVTYQGRTLSW